MLGIDLKSVQAVALGTILAGGVGCASAATEPEGRAFTLVYIRTGPMSGRLGEEENRRAFAGHFANMGRLAEERKLVVAGPFGKGRHDAALRGLFVLDTGDRAEAEAWASTDPTTLAGVFILEFHDFATDAPLVAALERGLERERQAKAEGRTPNPGDGARPYVLLIAEHRDATWRELAPLADGGGVLLLARLDGERAFALLDAKDGADAEQRFGAVLDRIGPHTLDDWFASDQLARMREP